MLTKDRIGGLLLLLFCSAYLYLSYGIRMLPFQKTHAFNAQTMPEALGFLGIGLSLAILVFSGKSEKLDLRGYNWGVGAWMIGLTIFYGFTIRSLGFIPSTTIFLMTGYIVLGERNPLILILASVPLVVAFWLLMTQALDIYVAPWPNPQSWLGFLWGIGSA